MHPFVTSDNTNALTPFNAFAPGSGGLGVPVWGREQLLRDLELRLGLCSEAPENHVRRVVLWAARMQLMAGKDRFYSASFARDPLGTARAVLSLRDSLRESGWSGQTVIGGGSRLEALSELESLATPLVPPGLADRASNVASALSQRRTRLYEDITLAEPEATWAGCWLRVFGALCACGTVIHTQPALPAQAPPETDLGKVQRALSSTFVATEPLRLRGDGTFMRFVAETSFDAAQAASALLATLPQIGSLIIRESEAALLDHSAHTRGLAPSGVHSTSPWRSALQVLPLAMELAFEPKDPQRVLELLNLADGPFAGVIRRYMTRALMRAPGVGGKAWMEAKERIKLFFAERDDSTPADLQNLNALATWFETPGANALHGASKAKLLEVVARVRGWLSERIAAKPTDTSLHVALQHCDALSEALELDARQNLDLIHVRRLTEFVVSEGCSLELRSECVGRIATVSSPRALHAPVTTLLWWMFTHHYEHPIQLPWRTFEQRALAEAGFAPPDPELQLLTRASGFRNAVLAAKERLFLIAPNSSAGRPCPSHPLWDEIVALVPLTSESQAAVTYSCAELLDEEPRSCGVLSMRTEPLEPLQLPLAHTTWNVAFEAPITFSRYSSSSLSSLMGCHLQWVLTYLAGLSTEEQALTSQHILNGALGHRLVEVLHESGAFDADTVGFAASASSALTTLFQQEGATLLRPGKAHELTQLRRQLVDAVCFLKAALDENELRIRSVETTFETAWRDRQIHGRWDLVVETKEGQPFIVDLKWGFKKYKDSLKTGNALQLALYGHAQSCNTSAPLQAAYYSLTGRRLFGVSPNIKGVEVVPGPSLAETWKRATLTLPLVEHKISSGQLHVAGVSRARSMLEHLGVAEAEQEQHYTTAPEAACEYCRYDAVCGRRWEATH